MINNLFQQLENNLNDQVKKDSENKLRISMAMAHLREAKALLEPVVKEEAENLTLCNF